MIRKIKRHTGSQSRVNIPKRGRIRFILFIALFGAAVKIKGAIIQDNPQPKEITEQKEKRQKKPKLKKPPKETTKKVNLGKEADFQEIKNLISHHGIDVNKTSQLIINGKDSLTFSLSIDTMLQEYALSLFQRYHPRYGAVAALDPVTGRILALISYTNQGETDKGKALYLKSIFPAASVFKTITAAAGIESAHMTAQSTIPHSGRNHTLYKFQLQKELKQYKDISLEEAYAMSINPAFARIALYMLEKGVLEDFGKRFGFNSPIPFELEPDVSEMFTPDSDFAIAEFASGFNEQTTISPLFGALLASSISEGGEIPCPTIVDSVYSSEKDTCIYTRSTKVWRKAIQESTADELKKLMRKVPIYGTARKSFRTLRQSTRFNEYEYGGKTGSVSKQDLGRVDWFVGFARHPQDPAQRIAVGVVTTHGDYWTVHSSYIASELFRMFLRKKQDQKTEKIAAIEASQQNN